MGLILRWRGRTTLPVEATGLLPATLGVLTPEATTALPVPVGRQTMPLGELFEVRNDSDAPADRLTFEGSLGHVRNLGCGLGEGQIVVRGDAGPYLGQAMSGGEIRVEGSVGPWAGCEMSGGMLRVLGSAGDHLGAARPGSRLGMRDGVILVSGSAGREVGRRMRRGLIAIAGDASEGLGRLMIAGTIVSLGAVGVGAGMGMKRGTLALLGRRPARLLPSFRDTGDCRLPFLAIYLRQLAAWGFPSPVALSGGRVRRYNGDLAAGGQGEILIGAGTSGD